MRSERPRTFSFDHVLRDVNGRAVGRAILLRDSECVVGEPIRLAVLTIPVSLTKNPKSLRYYVDGTPYRIPSDLPPLKLSQSGALHRVNSFSLVPEEV